jgi:glycosyltransferase involved in cell wall biosynthesis
MSLQQNFDVSVVILTRNSARTIEACLRSVIEEKPGEILVVDGVSTDATPSIVRRYGIEMISDPSRSLGRSRQFGVQAVRGAYVMFVDSDAVLTPGCMSTMRRELENYGWAGIHARILSAENVSYWQRAEQEEFSRDYDRAGLRKKIDMIAGLFKRDLLLRYPFDPYFVESAEDHDLCRRLVKNKVKLGGSDAVAYHHHRREFYALAKQRFRNGLGAARLGFKYRETRIFIDPLLTAISKTIRNVLTKRITLIPYWLVGGLIQFLGVLAGLSRIRRSSVNLPTSSRVSTPNPRSERQSPRTLDLFNSHDIAAQHHPIPESDLNMKQGQMKMICF